MITTSKLVNYQIPGKPLKQILGKTSTISQQPKYSQINKATTYTDPQKLQRYMSFQSGLMTYRLGLQRLLLSYPFINTDSTIGKDWSFSAVQKQLRNYFQYIQKSSIFQKYLIDKIKTTSLILTSLQNDVIIVPFIDLVNSRIIFQSNVNDLQTIVNDFDNGILNKKYLGLQSGTQNEVYNDKNDYKFVSRDKTYQGQVPTQYKQSINRCGQIFSLLPSVYYSNDFQFQSLLSIFRQNYDKIWFKNKAIKQSKYITYDKGQKQYLGDFIKQNLNNKGIQFYDINPLTMSNIILYNYNVKNINSSNSRYIPIGFSYKYLSDQFLYRIFTQKNLLIRAKGSRQPLQRLVNMYGLRTRTTGDFSGTGWVNIVDFQRYYQIDNLYKRPIDNNYFTDLQATIDDQTFDILANSQTGSDDTTFSDFGNPYGFGLVLDLVQEANNTLRRNSLSQRSLTRIDFSQSVSSYILGNRSLTGNRINLFDVYGPTRTDKTFSFTRQFQQIKKIDYILSPFFDTSQQFYPTKNNHIDGLYIKPNLYDLNTVSSKRISPQRSGLKRDGRAMTRSGIQSGDLIRHSAKYSDLKFFERKISSDIKVVPKRKTQIDISNITQLQSQYNARNTGNKSFSMSLSGYDIGSSTYRFKRRKDDTIGNNYTSNILNLMIQLKQSESKKIVSSTDQIIKISFNAVQDLYANSLSLDNLTQYNNIKRQFNYIDFYIYTNPLDKTTYITKKDLLQRQFFLPITNNGLLLSVYGWSGFEVEAQQVFEWTLGIDDLSSGDNIKFEFKFNRQ